MCKTTEPHIDVKFGVVRLNIISWHDLTLLAFIFASNLYNFNYCLDGAI